jgi:hypothetical protein
VRNRPRDDRSLPVLAKALETTLRIVGIFGKPLEEEMFRCEWKEGS